MRERPSSNVEQTMTPRVGRSYWTHLRIRKRFQPRKPRHQTFFESCSRWLCSKPCRSLNLSTCFLYSKLQMNWDESIEGLLQKYCDEAQTREALHRRSYYSYKKLTTCFSLPVIVLRAWEIETHFTGNFGLGGPIPR